MKITQVRLTVTEKPAGADSLTFQTVGDSYAEAFAFMAQSHIFIGQGDEDKILPGQLSDVAAYPNMVALFEFYQVNLSVHLSGKAGILFGEVETLKLKCEPLIETPPVKFVRE